MKLAVILSTSIAAMLLVGCSENNRRSPEDSIAPVSGEVISKGVFTGKSDHIVTGGVEIVSKDDEFYIQLGEDFSLDGAPDPKVGLGKNGYDKKTKSGALEADKGASTYKIPSGVDPKEYDEVYIWCEKFDVPLGVAKLSN